MSWPAADGNGAAVTRYTLYNDYGQVCTTTSALSCTVEGLANGWAYAFSVEATNEVGTSARSLPSNAVVPAGVPLQPSAPTALRGDQSARVSWYEVSGNGSPVTGYTVTSTPSGRTCVTTGESWCTVGGLANGTNYSFSVVATNDVGDSASSPPSSTTTPAGVPLPPGTPTAIRGDHRATVSWPAASGNGSPVTGYTVTSTPGYQGCTTTVALTCTVEGLVNGAAYTFSVTATNDLGTSAPSPESEETTPAGVPQRPLSPTAAGGDRSATLTWTAPAGNGSPVTGYTVTSTPGEKTCTTADALTCTVEGLTNGTAYTFTVTATNSVGDSLASPATYAVTPAGVPDRPAAPTAVRGDRSATVTWTAPAGNGSPVTGYTVTSTPGGITYTMPADLTSTTVSFLKNGTAYTFRVVATNAVGDGQPSEPSNTVTPAGVPDKPDAPTAVRGDRQATVTWTAPAGNGSPVSGYTVTSTPGEKTCTTTVALTCTVEGLVNGTGYTFSVTATNDLGTSAPSPESEETTPAGVPQRPLAPTAARGDRSATLTWTATAGNGSPVTGYTVTSTPGGKTCTTTDALTCTVEGLTNGTGYAFTVVATNNIGDSQPSEPSNQVTPAGVPDKPAAPTAVRGDRQATVTWTATAGNGSPVTGYTVTSTPGGKTCTTTDALTCTITGLTNGTGYTFTTAATNNIGDSTASEHSNQVTPAGVPDKPAAPTAVRGDRQATVTWTATAGNGSPVTGYTVTSTPGGKTCTTTDALTCTITGLTNGTGYTFTTAATNNIGDSTASEHSNQVTPAGVPAQPAAPTAVRGDRQATVTWAPVSGNGSPIDRYLVLASNDGQFPNPDYSNPYCNAYGTLSCTVHGLTNGVGYTFVVIASNEISGAMSPPSNAVIPAGVPARPAAPTAVRGDGQATVTWTATAGNGSPVTGYTVTSSPGGKTCSTTDATTCTITGLTNGTGHTFTVVATNNIGDSQPSEPSNQGTPAGVPAQPAAPTAVRGDGQATVTWTATAGNGSPVTGYTVTSSPGGKTCSTTDATTCTITGLTNGTGHTFTVVATNNIGDSQPSEPSTAVTPEAATVVMPPPPTETAPVPTPTPVPSPSTPVATAPSKMSAPKVVVRGRKAIVKWKTAVPNGSPITRYLIDISKGKDKTTAPSALEILFKRLKPGRYRIRIAARNAIGISPYSAWVTVRIH